MKTAATSQSRRRRARELHQNEKTVSKNLNALDHRDGEPSVVRRARQYVAKNYQEDLSLSDVAKRLNMSVFYLSRLFKRASGFGFAEYLGRIRVECAIELLANPELRISAIAFEVGFQSLSSFNRVFRRFTRISPTEYRMINCPRLK
jgi:AraC-like DNA-binding protein